MLKKLKSLFIIEEEEVPVKSAEAMNEGLEVDTSTGEVSEKFLKVLARAIEESNQEGFDYFEFREFIRALGSVDMDEETMYKSAFANAKTMGATLDRLSDSATHYLNVLGKERGKFEEAVKKRRTEVLDKRKQEMLDTEQAILSRKAEIERLNREIEELSQKVATQGSQIKEAEKKVNKTHGDFMRTYEHLVDQIRRDVEKIQTYLS